MPQPCRTSAASVIRGRGAPRRPVAILGLVITFVAICCCGTWAEAAATTAPGKPQVSDANSVISAYLVNFLRYVEWPENVPPAGEPWRIGVLDGEGLRTSLDRLTEGKMVRGRPISVIHSSDPAALLDCHLVMIAQLVPAAGKLVDAKTFSGRPILTVVYHEKEIAADVVMIELVLQGRKIRYRLNAALLTAHGLKPTPGLLENALPPAAPLVRSP